MTKSWARKILQGAGYEEMQIYKFFTFRDQNPDIYPRILEMVMEAWQAGIRRYSMKAIFEVLRWDKSIKRNSEFKLNNNFTAMYARLFIAEYPQFSDFFETREVRQ